MNRLIIEFSKTKYIGSEIISYFTRGEYSHVSIVLDSNTLLSPKMGKGVHVHDLDTSIYVKQEYWAIEGNPKQAIKWAREQIGSGYDYSGAAGFLSLFSFLDHRESKYHCSEFASQAIRRSKMFSQNNIDKYETWKIDPAELWRYFKLLSYLHNSPVMFLGSKLEQKHCL